MNDQTFLRIQAIELRRLLDVAGDDALMAAQLRVRLEDADKELEVANRRNGNLLPKEGAVPPRAAIFLRGGGSVNGSEGIRPSLAGEALILYEKMFTAQAIHDEREAARQAGRRRRPRGAPRPRLLFTGTPRGSFGLEFVAETTDDESLIPVHAESLVHVATALARIAESDDITFDQAINHVPAPVLQPLKQFMRTLAQHGAELRLAFADKPSRSLSVVALKRAAERLEKEVNQETIKVNGVFRGVARESGIFDLKLSNEEVITGTVADDLSEEDLEKMHTLTNCRCAATLQKTTVRAIVGSATSAYVLLEAKQIQSLD